MEPLTLHIDTTLPGASLSYQITGNGTEIDWGDGTPTTGPGTHTYDEHGQYTIRVYGGTGQIITCGSQSLHTVETFGDYEALGYIFGSATSSRQSRNLTTLPSELPSSVTNMGYMFYGCRFLTDISALAGWDVSSVTDMISMFSGCSSLTDISALAGWDVSSATNMISMFRDCSSLTDISALAGWDTGSVTNMNFMFEGCSSLTDISALAGWDVSSVTSMDFMFDGCSSLTTGDLSGWCVSNIPTEPRGFRLSTPNWHGPFPVWGTCPPPKPSYYGPNMLEADTPNWVCGKAPNALEAGAPNRLTASEPNRMIAPAPNALIAGPLNTLHPLAPNALKAPEPNTLEATEPNLVVPQGFAVLRG